MEFLIDYSLYIRLALVLVHLELLVRGLYLVGLTYPLRMGVRDAEDRVLHPVIICSIVLVIWSLATVLRGL